MKNVAKVGRSFWRDFPPTYPLPLGANKKLIQSGDIYKKWSDGLTLIRARPEHSPLFKQLVSTMFSNEVITRSLGCETIEEKSCDALTYNCLRYPLSFFAVNNQDEMVFLHAINVIYRNDLGDPLPRKSIACADFKHPFQAMVDILEWNEEEHHKRRGNKLIHQELAWTPTALREKKIYSRVVPVSLAHSAKYGLDNGIDHSVAIVTSLANRRAMTKVLGFKEVEQVPKERFVHLNGEEIVLPAGEERPFMVETSHKDFLALHPYQPPE